MDIATQTLLTSWEAVRTWITSLAFYVQAATIAAALLIAFVISVLFRRQIPIFSTEPEPGPSILLRRAARRMGSLLFLTCAVLLLGVAIDLSGRAVGQSAAHMRSATLETFDGKDIMVPNEQFITSSFVNWTHKDKKQRYSLEFSVAYKTDLREMLRLVKEVVATHPKVLSGPDLPVAERPDAEIRGFGDSGVNILVEFWMEGIDDGENRVGADLLMMIWDVLHEHAIEIPFPQREVKILNTDARRGR